jgi:hypothetical protein
MRLLASLLDEVLLADAHELGLLLGGLEATVTELGRSVDELELDFLERSAGSLLEERLAEGDDALLGADAAALDEHEVIEHGTVVGEATHGGDALLGEIELRGGVLVLDGTVGLLGSIADAIHLLVELGTVVVALLTGAGHRPADRGRVPRADATNLPYQSPPHRQPSLSEASSSCNTLVNRCTNFLSPATPPSFE